MRFVALASAFVIVAGATGVYALSHSKRAARAVAAAGDEEDGRPGPAREAPRAADEGRLAGEVAMLKAQVAELTRTAADGRGGQGGAAGADADKTPKTVEELRAQDVDQRATFMHGFVAAFQREPVDNQWAANTSKLVGETMAAADVGLEVRNIDCRSRTCRVELPDHGTTDQDKLEHAILNLTTAFTNTEIEHVDDGSGHPTSVVYLSRPAVTAER